MADKVRCENCGWHGTLDQALHEKSPFSEEMLDGCPKCKTADTLRLVCDAFGCAALSTCGTPTANGYRFTCGKHRPENQNAL